MTWRLLCAEVADGLAALPAASFQTCVTSPPYWGLRDYGVAGQLGLEATPAEYLARLVGIFEQVRRVLRPDGTLWLNMGDSYHSGNRGNFMRPRVRDSATLSGKRRDGDFPRQPHRLPQEGLKDKDLVGMPWRLALALQAAGWWLRADIIWSKPNPMPESVRDRPTRSHEYLFLLTPSAKYFYDGDAVREPRTSDEDAVTFRGGAYVGGETDNATMGRRKVTGNRRVPKVAGWNSGPGAHGNQHPSSRAGISAPDYDGRKFVDRSDGLSRPPMTMRNRIYHPLGRNRRTVWSVATVPYAEAHFATFPPALIEPCILAGTSDGGACATCGRPWARGGDGAAPSWARTCRHKIGAIPCSVLDPFAGSGTTGEVSIRHGRDFTGIELSPEYCKLAERRLARASAQLGLFAPQRVGT